MDMSTITPDHPYLVAVGHDQAECHHCVYLAHYGPANLWEPG